MKRKSLGHLAARRRDVSIAVMIATIFIEMIGFGIIIPVLPFYGQRFGASDWDLGALVAIFGLFQFLFAFLLGHLSDRFGRKPVLLGCLFFTGVSLMLMAYADSLWMLFVGRAIGGAAGANVAVANAYIADMTRPHERARYLAFVGMAFGGGMIFGPALGGVLSGDQASPLPFAIAGGLAFVAVLVGLVFMSESLQLARIRHRADSPEEQFETAMPLLRKPAVVYPMIGFVVLEFLLASLQLTFPLWAQRRLHWGPVETGYFYAYLGVLIVFVQGWLIGRLVREVSERTLAMFGAIMMIAAFVIVAYGTQLAHALVAGALVAFGFGIASPALNGLVSRNSPPHLQGGIMGVTQSAANLMRAAGPSVGGWLIHEYAIGAPFYASAATLAVTAVALGLFSRGLTPSER